jgi:glutamine synthetase
MRPLSSPKGKRVEVRYPDPAANPYLGFAAMLMAGLDGIQIDHLAVSIHLFP